MSVWNIWTFTLLATAICIGFVALFAMASSSDWQPYWPAYIEWFGYLLAVYSPKIAAIIAAGITFISLEKKFGRLATTLSAVVVFAVVFGGGNYVIRSAMKDVAFSPQIEAKKDELHGAGRKALEMQRNLLSGARELVGQNSVGSNGVSQ